jgi:hypothetical protein
VTLQQDIDTVKVENDVVTLNEEGSFHAKIDEVYSLSALSIKESKPEVSLVFR